MKLIGLEYSTLRREVYCEHGVGHGNHVHGCDGCCKKGTPVNKLIKKLFGTEDDDNKRVTLP